MERDVVVLGAMRTAIGTFGGSLKDVPMTRLATVAVKAALDRSDVPVEKIGHVVMGNVVPTEPKNFTSVAFQPWMLGSRLKRPHSTSTDCAARVCKRLYSRPRRSCSRH